MQLLDCTSGQSIDMIAAYELLYSNRSADAQHFARGVETAA